MGIDDKYSGVGGSYMLDENGERVQIDAPGDRFWNDQTATADAETVEKPEEAAAPEKADAVDERKSWI